DTTLFRSGVDLYAMAWRLSNHSDLAKWKEKYRLGEDDIERAKKRTVKSAAEIIVLFENGISPKKGPHPSFYSVPKFFPRCNPVTAGTVTLTNAKGEAVKDRTTPLMDIEAVAIQNLDEKWGGILAKKLAGILAKESIGEAVDAKTGRKGWGQLVKLAFYLSDQADTRSWNLLPKDLQLSRFLVSPGTYTVK